MEEGFSFDSRDDSKQKNKRFKPFFGKHGLRSKFNNPKHRMTPHDDKLRNVRHQANNSLTHSTIKERVTTVPANMSNHNFNKKRLFTMQNGANNRQKFNRSQIHNVNSHSRSPNESLIGEFDKF